MALCKLSLWAASHTLDGTLSTIREAPPIQHQSRDTFNRLVRYASPIPERVIRKIPSDGPSMSTSFALAKAPQLMVCEVTDDQDPNLACNTGGELGAGLVANASAGSIVKFEWTNVRFRIFFSSQCSGEAECEFGMCSGHPVGLDAQLLHVPTLIISGSDHLGPVSTYMTSCGEDCTKFDVNGAKWFKIDAEGYGNGSWASAKLIASMPI